ncbi:MAG: hypothetical protein JNK04_21150 [Myxococcales bacterium]|nr:hypothetical protein [Myxococcales bacterium]
MSWVLHFELQWRNGGEVPSATRVEAGRALRRCFSKTRHLGLITLEPNEEEPLRGAVQILHREGNESDFALLLTTLQQIARREPGVLITGADDFYLKGEDVLEVGEARAVLKPDPTNGAGVFRAHVTPTDHVYRAQAPELNSQDAARSFVDQLTTRGLIEWCGPPDAAIGRLATLVEQVKKGRWRDASKAFAVLEDDPNVEEIHATDRQLDDLWRKLMNQF